TCLYQQIEVLDHRRSGKERADNTAPFLKSRRFAEINRVIFQRGPVDLDDITLGRFDTFVDGVTLIAFGLADDCRQTALHGFIKFGLLAWLDADVHEFENHECSCEKRGMRDYDIVDAACDSTGSVR